jgi:hypothetical protein
MAYYLNHTLSSAIQEINPTRKLILEFGVHGGNSIRMLRNMLDPSFDVWGFDTFTGLPEDWSGTDLKKGMFDMGGNPPEIDIDHGEVTFFVGLFSDTLPELVRAGAFDEHRIGLIHVDCDMYSSTVDILRNIGHLIQEGTVIVFDEWIYNFDPKCDDHEQKAFKEWAEAMGREYEFIDVGSRLSGSDMERKAVRILR